jgi:hypothetical protein
MNYIADINNASINSEIVPIYNEVQSSNPKLTSHEIDEIVKSIMKVKNKTNIYINMKFYSKIYTIYKENGYSNININFNAYKDQLHHTFGIKDTEILLINALLYTLMIEQTIERV